MTTANAISFRPQSPSQLYPIAQVVFHILEAELGSLLLNSCSLEHVSDFLRPDHFAHAVHGRIYESIQKCRRAFICRSDLACLFFAFLSSCQYFLFKHEFNTLTLNFGEKQTPIYKCTYQAHPKLIHNPIQSKKKRTLST